MPKIKIKTISALLFILLFISTPLTSLIVRFTVYTKTIVQKDGSVKTQRIVLCGDNHVIGTPKNNLTQWCNFLKQLKDYKQSSVSILVENQRLASQWFNDPIDQKLQAILQKDLIYCLNAKEPGTLTLLSLIGLPPTFFPPYYHSTIKKLDIINLECRQFLCYTALLNQDALRQNISNPNLIASVKKLQDQKIKTLTLNGIFKPVSTLDSYKNDSPDKKIKNIYSGIKQRITQNWTTLTKEWKREFPDLDQNKPITTLRHHYQQSHGMLFNGRIAYKIVNPFEQDLCISLIDSQFMDEMIEANAFWNITKPNAADTIIALVGSTHSGHLDIVHVKYTLAEHLLALGYKHVSSFGLEDIHNVDALYCSKVSKEIPRQLFTELEKNNSKKTSNLTVKNLQKNNPSI